jgi:hypothetical protein
VTVTGGDPAALQLALDAAALKLTPTGSLSVALTLDGVAAPAFATVSV